MSPEKTVFSEKFCEKVRNNSCFRLFDVRKSFLVGLKKDFYVGNIRSAFCPFPQGEVVWLMSYADLGERERGLKHANVPDEK